jgi:hypothetical protein
VYIIQFPLIPPFSDEAELTVAEQIGTDANQQQANMMSTFGILNEANDAETNEIQLFTRSGATNGGWHRASLKINLWNFLPGKVWHFYLFFIRAKHKRILQIFY